MYICSSVQNDRLHNLGPAFSVYYSFIKRAYSMCLYMRKGWYIRSSVLPPYVPAGVYPSLHLSDIPVSCYLSPTHVLSFKAVYLSLSLPFQLVHSFRLSPLVSFRLSDRLSAKKELLFSQYLSFHLLFRPLFFSISKPRQMSHPFSLRSLTAKTNRTTYRMRSSVKKNKKTKLSNKTTKNIGIMCLQSGRISASAITVISECVLYEMGFTGFHLLYTRESGAE